MAKIGRPRVWDVTCDACRLAIADDQPVVFAKQWRSEGPYSGMGGWYVTRVHVEPCGESFLFEAGERYTTRVCWGCHRTMWVRPGNRRRHCSGTCRQLDYRRRSNVRTEALNRGVYMYLDEALWVTRPEAFALGN